MDTLTPEARSRTMSHIRGKDTAPERMVRSMLHKMGYRFRLHVARLPGKPDIVLPRRKAVILVHGCFWHGHEGCRRAGVPATNTQFWLEKIAANKARDARTVAELEKAGYRCLIIWQCELKNPDAVKRRLSDFLTENRQEPA